MFDRRSMLITACLLALVAGAFWPGLEGRFITIDDNTYVSENYHVLRGFTLEGLHWSLTTRTAANWHPLTWWSLMVDAAIWGNNPLGFKLTNLLLHAANSLLLFTLLRRWSIWRAAIVAAVWAVHPLRVESVTWVSERKDVLAAFFGLLGIRAYCANSPAAAAWRAAPWMALSLLAKPMLVTLPCLLLLLDIWPLGRLRAAGIGDSNGTSTPSDGSALKRVIEKWPLWALAVIFSAVTFWVQREAGAMSDLKQLPLEYRAANTLISYVRYLGMMIWPVDLAVLYPHPGQWPAAWVAGAAGGLVVLTAGAVLLRRRQPHLLIGWLWYVGLMVPVIGLVQVGVQALADRYTYLPTIGLLIAGAWAIPNRWLERRATLAAILAIAGGLSLALTWTTRRQTLYWADSITMFRHTLGIAPRNPVMHNSLGVALNRIGRADEAEPHFRAALALDPEHGEAWGNLGNVLVHRGADPATTLELFHNSVRFAPHHAEAYYNLANVLMLLGDVAGAEANYRRAIQLKPTSSPPWNNLGNALLGQGRVDEAAQAYRESIRIDPTQADPHNNLGVILLNHDRLDEAASLLQTALKLNPRHVDAHLSYGSVLVRLGRVAESLPYFLRAVELHPAHPKARLSLGNTYENLNQIGPAIEQYQLHLRQFPDDAEVAAHLQSLIAKPTAPNR